MLSFLLEKEFKQLGRRKIVPGMTVALTLMTMFLFPWAANQEIRNIRVAVVDHDRSTLSQKLSSELAASAYFDLAGLLATHEDAMVAIESDKADMILEIPGSFEKNLVNGLGTSAMVSANAVNSTKGTLGSLYMLNMMENSTVLKEASRGADISAAEPFTVSSLYKFNKTLDYKVFMIPALMVVVLTIICGFFPAMSIVSEKERGTIEQMNVAPVRKIDFILSKMIPQWAIGLLVLAFCLIAAYLVYGLAPAGSIWTILLLSSIYILVVSGIGLIISNAATNMQQAMFIMYFFTMILLLMSGIFTPVSSMPGWGQCIAAFNPLKYFVEGIRMVYLKGSTIIDMWRQIGALSLFAVFFGLWAIASYRRSA